MKKRMRVFVGPNGSGKSTITALVRDKVDLGIYCNADEIKQMLCQQGSLDFADFRLTLSEVDFIKAAQSSSFATLYDVDDLLRHVHIEIAYKENGTLETVTDTVPVWYTRFVTDKLKMLE